MIAKVAGRAGARLVARCFGQLAAKGASQVTRSDRLQFSKSRLEFGELPFGEIPEPLKYSRPLGFKQLANGVKVCTETWGSRLSGITIAIRSGSRQETLATSGASNLIAQLCKHGTTTRSAADIAKEVDLLGGELKASTSRENIFFSLTFESGKHEAAFKLLHDVVFNSLQNPASLEAAKQMIVKRSESIDDPYRVIKENAYYTSFRDDFIGQPSTGIRQNIVLLTPEHLKEYKAVNFIGPNVVVSGSGALTLEQLTSLSSSLESLSPNAVAVPLNARKPVFTPSVMMLRDDELANTSVAVSFKAPSFSDPDWFGMQLVKEVVGDYRIDRDNLAHLNTVSLDYNKMHVSLANLPDVVRQLSYYNAYSDTGLFGNFLFGNEVFNHALIFMSQYVLTSYAHETNVTEIYRGRARVFNNLLNRHCPFQISKENALQASYWGRLCSRTEIATKVSCYDEKRFQRLIKKWFYDKEISVAAWGPLHNIIKFHTYNKLYKRSTLGKYGYVTAWLGL